MKIGILTYWSTSDNYGQVLQCYALQTYLRNKGHNAYLIRFKHNDTWLIKFKKSIRFYIGAVIRAINKNRRNQYRLIKEKIERNQEREFDIFRDTYIVSTERVYTSLHELRRNPPDADCYIVGSDQVWRNKLNDTSSALWFLKFGEQKIIRASYAASIGRKLFDYEEKKFKDYVSNLDFVSVREKSTLLYCKKIGIKNVQICVDPTLLVESDIFKIFIKTSTSNPYIFLYQINVNRKEEVYWDEILHYSSMNNYGIKVVSSSGYFLYTDIIPKHELEYDTIPEWLNSIYHATAIITTSFHGVVFSILFHRPFVAVVLNNEYKEGNNRIIDLLDQLNLRDRIIFKLGQIEDAINKEIDWNNVDTKLNQLKKTSLIFWDDIINYEKKDSY